MRYVPIRMAGKTSPGVLLIALLVAAIGAACSSPEPTGKKVHGQGVYIPAHWAQTRGIDGHKVHVVKEKVACSDCHQLTDTTIGPVDMVRCKSCHEKQAAIVHAEEQAHARFGPGIDADCRSCHIFTLHPPKDDPREPTGATHANLKEPFEAGDCLRCHAEAQGDLEPVVVHRPAGCLNCHQPHEPGLPTSAPCSQCHEDVTTTHASEGRTVVETCRTCHQSQHAPAEAAVSTCATCHESGEAVVPKTALFEDGHAECIACHRPHEFGKASAVACLECHEEKPVLSATRVAAHRDCKSCHTPHDVTSASATSCTKCHASISPNHPKHGEAGTCTGCHDPHPASAGAPRVRNCTSCHHQAPNEHAFHEGVSCRDCHRPHKFLLAQAGVTLCSQCHSENVQAVDAHPGHQECTSCHGGLPHRPSRLNAACSSCHQAIQAKVNPGHSNCQSCHEPHGTEMVKQCGDCHAPVVRSAPKGHSRCTDCHDQHSGAQKQKACSTCHKEEASTPHGKLGSDCSSCHRPHGPEGVAKPPACGSCHQKPTLPGLHDVSQHSRCTDCHTPHGQRIKPERPVCMTCHSDKKKHFPDASTCSSCHIFTKTK